MSDDKTVKMVDKTKSTDLGYQPKKDVLKNGYQPNEIRGFQPSKPTTSKPLPNMTSSVQTPSPVASSNTGNEKK